MDINDPGANMPVRQSEFNTLGSPQSGPSSLGSLYASPDRTYNVTPNRNLSPAQQGQLGEDDGQEGDETQPVVQSRSGNVARTALGVGGAVAKGLARAPKIDPDATPHANRISRLLGH